MGMAWQRAKGVRLALAAVAAGFLLASCSPSSIATAPSPSTPAGQRGSAAHHGGVISLTAISTLRSLFNRANGHTRLVLIFSPT